MILVLNSANFRSGSAVSGRSKSGSRSRSRSRSGTKKSSRSRSRSRSGSPAIRKKRNAILSDSEDDDGQPKAKMSRPKITDSDHEGEENEPKEVKAVTATEAANKLGDSSGDENIDDRPP